MISSPQRVCRSFVLCLLLFLLATSSFAQTRIYYNEFFAAREEKKTKYFRELVDTDSGAWVMEMSNDTLMAKGFIRPNGDLMLMNDFAHFVRSFGSPYQSKTEFATLRADIDYYHRGVKLRKFVARSGKVLYAQHWSEDGEALLKDGNGTHDFTSGGESFHQSFKDSVMTEMFGVQSVEGDTLYYTYDKMAEPEDGYQEFTQDLVKILKYPGFARLMGKQGVVYVQFVIDKNGKLTEFKPLTSEGFNLEKRAVEQLSRMPNWKPAIFRGRPVKMKFTIPIRFRLT